MKKYTRIVTLLLALMLCSGVLLSCSGGSNSGTTANPSGNADSTTAATEAATTVLTAEVPKEDYKGYEFRFLGEKITADKMYDDFKAEEETGQAINDAVFRRNAIVEDYLNVKIGRVEQSNPHTVLNTAVLAGDDSFDACQAITTNMAGAIKNNYLVTLDQMKYIDPEKPWWTSAVMDGMEIAGKSWFLLGDLLTRDKDTVWCLVFNKRMYKDYGLTEPYDMIRSGKWTMDVLQQHCQNVSKDLNGDGKLDWHDQWGLLGSDTAVIGTITSCDIITIINDPKEGLKLNLNTESNVNKLQKLFSFFTDSTMQLRAQDITGVDSIWTAIIQVFREGRALYRISIMQDVIGLRDMEDDFGILPMPKYDENQKDYISNYQNFNCRGLTIPITNTNLDRTGAVLEYMAYASKDTVREAYYDVTLTGKVARDKDSTDMLDIIFGSLTADVGLMTEVGGLRNTIVNMMKVGAGNIASTLASENETLVNAIKELEDAVKNSK